MIITENEGYNLNSPTIQALLQSFPPDKLATTKVHYGSSPMKETVNAPFLSDNNQEESNVPYWMNEQNPQGQYGQQVPQQPYSMSQNIGYGNMLPQMSFNGALSQNQSPSYFDFTQPGGYIPTTNQKPQYSYGTVSNGAPPPVSQMQAANSYGYNGNSSYNGDGYSGNTNYVTDNGGKYGYGYGPNGRYEYNYWGVPVYQQMYSVNVPGDPYASYDFNDYYRLHSAEGILPENVIRTPDPPRHVIMSGPGTIYSNVEHRMYPGVQSNPYNPMPSNEFVERLVHKASRFDNYYNPFMSSGPNANDMQNEAIRMARHNYAMQFGFHSLEEMEANDMAVLKTVSLMVNRYLGMSEEEAKAHVKRLYEDPYQPKKELTLAEKTKRVEEYQKAKDKFKLKLKITIRRGDEIIKSYDPDVDPIVKFENDDRSGVFIRDEQIAAQIDMACRIKYNNAMERQFDDYSIVKFFNEAFYDLHIRDMKEEDKRRKNKMVRELYSHEHFKRELIAKFGRPAQRARLMEEDIRFHKNDPTPEGMVRGSYGKMPFGLPMDPKSDPRLGYCYLYDLNGGGLTMDMPLNDERLKERKNRFLAAAGCKVPLYVAES